MCSKKQINLLYLIFKMILSLWNLYSIDATCCAILSAAGAVLLVNKIHCLLNYMGYILIIYFNIKSIFGLIASTPPMYRYVDWNVEDIDKTKTSLYTSAAVNNSDKIVGNSKLILIFL